MATPENTVTPELKTPAQMTQDIAQNERPMNNDNLPNTHGAATKKRSFLKIIQKIIFAPLKWIVSSRNRRGCKTKKSKVFQNGADKLTNLDGQVIVKSAEPQEVEVEPKSTIEGQPPVFTVPSSSTEFCKIDGNLIPIAGEGGFDITGANGQPLIRFGPNCSNVQIENSAKTIHTFKDMYTGGLIERVVDGVPEINSDASVSARQK